MQNENNNTFEESTSTGTQAESEQAQKCCSECNCTGYDQDHDNICKCGHNSERHIC